MIKDGDFTIIGGETFHVVKTDEAYAYLHNVKSYKGRPRKMLLSQVPYFGSDGKLITPKVEKTKIPSRKLKSKVNIREIIAENTDMQVSKNAIMWLHEQLSSICETLLEQAVEKAKHHEDKRIEPRHIQHVPIPESANNFVYQSHDDYVKDGI
tara:strand:+ start:280 stop:738 length:459 start_codon:yes stop_codon:yes gene_type:complete